MAVTVTLGVMMIAFGMTVIVIVRVLMIVIVRVLMIGLAAACQKQNSDKEGKKRLHSARTLATLEPLGKSLKRAKPHFSRGHFWNGSVGDWVLSSWNFFHLAR
jgi:sensor histidine kinase regulating citrate/malate metabolism